MRPLRVSLLLEVRPKALMNFCFDHRRMRRFEGMNEGFCRFSTLRTYSLNTAALVASYCDISSRTSFDQRSLHGAHLMKIGIVGLGLIGGCLGIDFRALGHEVYGTARREKTCQQALERGIVDIASTQIEALAPCDIVFVCTPIATILPMVKALSSVLRPETVITDVGSVKAAIATEATELWPQFVGGHPMSGKSEAGLEAASAGLFQGNSYVITPVETAAGSTCTKAVQVVEQLAKDLGSRLYHCTPEVHDRAVAWISHLPVMVSTNLIEAAMDEPDSTVRALAQKLASSGFKDTSRVGGGNPELGLMMAQYNQAELLRSLKLYQVAIAHTIDRIEAEDWNAIAHKLSESKTARPRFVDPIL